MNLGYPCSNLTIDAYASRSFRLASYSPELLLETVQLNLDALLVILEWNREQDIRYFRLPTNLIPFASHPIMDAEWQRRFADQLAAIGSFIVRHAMRITVHPGQYILLDSPSPDVVAQNIADLDHQCKLFDLMRLDATHKVQIHTGGVAGGKAEATRRFIKRYPTLPARIRARLVIENDERLYSLRDNLIIHEACGIPLVFDTFHHRILNTGESLPEAFDLFMPTWNGHGTPMLDYSSQHEERQIGAHTMSIDIGDFATVIENLRSRDADIMLEIKDKEQSVLKAREWIRSRHPVRSS